MNKIVLDQDEIAKILNEKTNIQNNKSEIMIAA
jgi:hypothetical protein